MRPTTSFIAGAFTVGVLTTVHAAIGWWIITAIVATAVLALAEDSLTEALTGRQRPRG